MSTQIDRGTTAHIIGYIPKRARVPRKSDEDTAWAGTIRSGAHNRGGTTAARRDAAQTLIMEGREGPSITLIEPIHKVSPGPAGEQ